MPTGYTAGILDGSINSFQEFAKLCIRAFGATIHMRDDSLSSDWVPRTPSEFHAKEIAVAEKLLNDANSLTDEEIIEANKDQLLKSKAYHIQSIAKAKANSNKLYSLLQQAEKYNPPTDDHTDIKDFMIQQLHETIKFDGDASYHEDALLKINNDLQNLNADILRQDMIAAANKNLHYHTTQLQEEIDRCNKSNKWAIDFFTSINIDTKNLPVYRQPIITMNNNQVNPGDNEGAETTTTTTTETTVAPGNEGSASEGSGDGEGQEG